MPTESESGWWMFGRTITVRRVSEINILCRLAVLATAVLPSYCNMPTCTDKNLFVWQNSGGDRRRVRTFDSTDGSILPVVANANLC